MPKEQNTRGPKQHCQDTHYLKAALPLHYRLLSSNSELCPCMQASSQCHAGVSAFCRPDTAENEPRGGAAPLFLTRLLATFCQKRVRKGDMCISHSHFDQTSSEGECISNARFDHFSALPHSIVAGCCLAPQTFCDFDEKKQLQNVSNGECAIHSPLKHTQSEGEYEIHTTPFQICRLLTRNGQNATVKNRRAGAVHTVDLLRSRRRDGLSSAIVSLSMQITMTIGSPLAEIEHKSAD